MRKEQRAFSLVEVVVAVGVFVAGVVAAVALLSQTTRSAGARLEQAVAARVVHSTAVLLQSEAWDAVLSRADGDTPVYADRTGERIDLVDTLPERERFYAVHVERDDAAPAGTPDATAAHVTLRLTVRWPAQDDAGQALDQSNQEILQSRVVVRR
jgi:uncharacterized protein (TIGR02598 family)